MNNQFRIHNLKDRVFYEGNIAINEKGEMFRRWGGNKLASLPAIGDKKEDFHIEWHTGMTDNLGNDIYIADWVRVINDEGEQLFRGVVRFHNGTLYIRNERRDLELYPAMQEHYVECYKKYKRFAVSKKNLTVWIAARRPLRRRDGNKVILYADVSDLNDTQYPILAYGYKGNQPYEIDYSQELKFDVDEQNPYDIVGFYYDRRL